MEKFLTTKEVAKLLNINEKKVYYLAQEGIIPATKVTGKWLFPEDELIDFLKFNALKNIKKGIASTLLEKNVLIGAGSDDPILTKIFSEFYTKTNINIFYTTVGSENGIELLKNRISHFSLSHIYDEKEKDFNFPYLKKNYPENEYAIINFFKRDIGIISKFKINSIEEIYGKTFILRQKGSGIRIFTDTLFNSGKLNKEKLNFYKDEVTTHFEVANLVNEKDNYVGIATYSVAKIFGLNFYKLFDERFDLITLKEYFFTKTFQNLYSFINFFFSTLKINGYDFSSSGQIIAE